MSDIFEIILLLIFSYLIATVALGGKIWGFKIADKISDVTENSKIVKFLINIPLIGSIIKGIGAIIYLVIILAVPFFAIWLVVDFF